MAFRIAAAEIDDALPLPGTGSPIRTDARTMVLTAVAA